MKTAILNSSFLRVGSILFLMLSGAYIDLQAQGGYYLTGTVSNIGVKIVDGGAKENSSYCTVKTRLDIVRFTPDEVSEYGFADGRVFVAKTINYEGVMINVFLERLSMGRLVLYYYHGSKGKSFFIETKDGEISELESIDEEGNSYRHSLTQYIADFPEGLDAIQNVPYRKEAMKSLFVRYERREHRPFPRFRYGVALSYGFTDLIPQGSNEIMDKATFRKDGSFSAGVFADQPIYLSDLSLNVGINISRQVYSLSWTSENGDEDFYATTTSVGIPLLLRYSWPSNKLRPFLNAGGLAVLNLSNNNILYRTTFIANTTNLEIDKTHYISDSYSGFTAGAGVEYRLRGRGSILTELRYSVLWPSEKPELINMKVLNITMGYSF